MGNDANLNEVTLGACAIPTALQFGTLLLAALDQLQYFIELLVVDLRQQERERINFML